MRNAQQTERMPWLPASLAAFAFVAFAVAFVYELVTYQGMAVSWANGDINSRAHLAADNLVEPLRTQDFSAIQRIGRACEADGVHLLVTSARGGVVFDSCPSDVRNLPFYSKRFASGEYEVSVGMPVNRVLAPFKMAIRGFFLAGLVGITGVVLFFFVTYRQRVRITELTKLEAFRRNFLADVSHEIKTPLTGILGAVDLLGEATESGTQAALLGMIRREGVRLNALVQQILDLARLEREGEVLSYQDVNLGDLVRESVSCFAPEAASRGVRLEVGAFPADADCTVRADGQLILQALGNLVANALRHSGSPVVTVGVSVSDTEARLTVEDHGCGIPPDQAERVFERFHRVDPSRAAETGGAGLGLAIIRRIARLHGGEAWLEAVVPSGCRFVFTIPRMTQAV